MPKPDEETAWERLCRLLAEAGAEVTFSANCRSGFVGREKCNCWRCRKERGAPVTEETETLAKKESAESRKNQREAVRRMFRSGGTDA